MTECPDIELTHALADGELSGESAQRAREHVAQCRHCQSELADIMHLASLPAPRRGSAASVPAVISLAWYRSRKVQSAAVALSAAAAVALYVAYVHRSDGTEPAPRVALAQHRPIEARLSWSGAAGYRAYDVPRAGEAAGEAISLDTLARAEKRGDLHGVGVLSLLNGDRKQAAGYLSRAGESSAVLTDRAALALANADPAAALALTDAALDKTPKFSAALWNRGLALRDLGLSHSAAEAFHAVAALSEPGWADEAKRRATTLDAEFTAQLDLSVRVAAAAKPLATTFEGLSPDDARALPGRARMVLYDAIRAAPTREALAKLRPLAEAIDAVDHTTTAVAALTRTPVPQLANAYAALVAGNPPPRDAYLAALRSANASDLLIGALLKFGTSFDVHPADVPEFARLAAASSDPWIQMQGLEQQALAALTRGDLAAAETFALRAPAICAAGAPNYSCLKLSILAGEIYFQWHRLPEARVALSDAWRRARASGQWQQQGDLLVRFAQLAALSDDATGGGLPLAQAYAEEVAARHRLMERRGLVKSACTAERWASEHIAMVQINRHRFEDAARQIAKAPSCNEELSPVSLFIRSQIAQLSGRRNEIEGVQRSIEAARARPNVTASDRVVLDHAEGRLWIDFDPQRAEQRLRQSIAATRSTPSLTPDSKRLLGPSYSLMAIAAGRRGDATGTLDLLGQEIGATVPRTCVLGLAADDTAIVAAARGADGSGVATVRARVSLDTDPTSLVPTDVATALAACTVVDVIARPPVHGKARILPASTAWRYLSVRSSAKGPSAERRVVVANVEPPSALDLPRLGVWSAQNVETISGSKATPSRVLAALADAGDIVLHAHGLVDQENASYLALSPDAAGNYTLTAAAVREARLSGHPLVILAACSAARAAPVVHERWSLPDAFIAAGANAVLASSSAIPDADATAFFDALRARVLAGAPVAVALRDVRQQWISERAQDWVRDVILFE